MCFDAIGDFLEEAARDFVGASGPDDIWSPDVASVQRPQTRLDNVSAPKKQSNVVLEPFEGETFERVYGKFLAATVPCGVAEAWGDIRNKVLDETRKFDNGLAKLDVEGGWKGHTHDAAIANVGSSLTEPVAAGDGAGAMEILVEAWSKTINSIYTHIHANWENYQSSLNAHPEFQDHVRREYNSFAQKVMLEIYEPNVRAIAENNPAFTQGGPPQVGGTGPGSLGGGSGFGGPKIPDFGGPQVPDLSPPGRTDPSTVPGPPDSLTDPVRAASDAAQNALGPAADAANKAAEAAKDAGQRRLPEGVLGLGPKGLGGAGGAGKTGGGAGARPRGLASGRPAGAPASMASKMPTTPTRAAAAGAGIGAMGPPGAGAPAAGQRGGEGAAHTPSKALRRKKNGQKVAGEAEAVVPVVGAPEKRPMAEANQPDQSDQTDQPDGGGGGVRAAPWTARGAERAKSSV